MTKTAKKKPLSFKRQLFVDYYVGECHFNATQAAIRAGYSERTARKQGSRLLTFADVRAAIDEATNHARKRNAELADKVIDEYRKLAFTDISEIVTIEDGVVTVMDTADMTPDQHAIISEISHVGENGIRIKVHNKLPALEALSRHFGLFNDKLDVTVSKVEVEWGESGELL